jgi:hypothetical protein
MQNLMPQTAADKNTHIFHPLTTQTWQDMYSPLEEPIEHGRTSLEGSGEGPKDGGAGFEGDKQDLEGDGGIFEGRGGIFEGHGGIFEGDRGDPKGSGMYWPQSDEEFIHHSLHAPAATPTPTPTPTPVTICHVRPSLHKHKYSTLMVSASVSPASFLPPRRHHTAIPPIPDMSFLGGHISDISDAIRDATGQPTGLKASPLQKHRAVRSAEECEGDLDEEDLIALVNIFTADVSAADTYMELRQDGL